MATTNNPYELVVGNLQRQQWDYNNKLKALNAKKNSIGWFNSVADAIRFNKLSLSIQNISKQLDDARKQYQTYNNSIISANTKGLTPEYSQIYNSIAGPTLKSTDRYINDVSNIFEQTNKDSATLIEQNIADATTLADAQRAATIQQESNQAGLVAWIGSRTGLNTWQIIAWQDIVNADKNKQLAEIDKAKYDNTVQQRNNYITMLNNLAQVQQGLESTRLGNIGTLNNTVLQVQQAQLQRQQQLAEAAKLAKWGGWGWSTFNPTLPNVPWAKTWTNWISTTWLNTDGSVIKPIDLSLDLSPTYALEQNKVNQIAKTNTGTGAYNTWEVNTWAVVTPVATTWTVLPPEYIAFLKAQKDLEEMQKKAASQQQAYTAWVGAWSTFR